MEVTTAYFAATLRILFFLTVICFPAALDVLQMEVQSLSGHLFPAQMTCSQSFQGSSWLVTATPASTTELHVPRPAHFFSVGDIRQKKETCSGGDGFLGVRGCFASCSL